MTEHPRDSVCTASPSGQWLMDEFIDNLLLNAKEETREDIEKKIRAELKKRSIGTTILK